jgi:hypothetical protein
VTDLDPVDDLANKLKAAKYDGLKLSYARMLVKARFDRGDYVHVLQDLDGATLEALSRAAIREMEKEKLGE